MRSGGLNLEILQARLKNSNSFAWNFLRDAQLQ
jgi:hypothetical protein